jgi:hypothetical protein
MFRIVIGSAPVETPPHPEPSLRSDSDLSPQAGEVQLSKHKTRIAARIGNIGHASISVILPAI